MTALDEGGNEAHLPVPITLGTTTTKTLAAVTLLDALDRDDRPSFAVKTQTVAPYARDAPLDPVYVNPALMAVEGLLQKVTGQQVATSLFTESTTPQLAFRDWVRGGASEGDLQRRGNAYTFEGHVWSAISIGDYRVVSGVQTLLLWGVDAAPGGGRQRGSSKRKASENNPPAPLEQAQAQATGSVIPPSLTTAESWAKHLAHPPHARASPHPLAVKHGPFDYTSETLSPAVKLDPHIAYFRSVDWARTPLGPMSSWPADLRTTINAILNNSFPGVLFWGDQVIMVYNDAYTHVLGALHPCMGKSIKEAAPEHWASFEPLVTHINETGTSFAEHDMLLFVDRHGHLEETHWSFQFVPVLDKHGHIAAYFQSLYEITPHRLLERRVLSLVEMGSQSANARNLQSFWDITLQSLTLNDKDVPFALVYAAERNHDSDLPSSPGSAQPLEVCLLKGSIGVDAGHPAAPASIHIHNDSYVFRPFLLEAAKTRKAVIVHLDDLDSSPLEGVDWKGYGDPCRTLIVCPILPTTGEAEGFLILGTNPRSPLDEKYQQYVQVMLRLLATSLASVLLFEEEVRQRENAIVQAARIQEQLLAELQLKEKKFQRFAERSDVGIFIMDAAGNYTYRNQRWYDLFDVAGPEDSVQTAWSKIVFPEDLPRCEAMFGKLVLKHEPVNTELRTQITWTPPNELKDSESDDAQHFKWILCSAYAEVNASGELVEIVGNITDISRQKWAEGIQKIRTDSALESKQHLEHFIDTTSHEMRNPLSAILQCADGILSSYSPEDCQQPMPNGWWSFLEQTLDAAQTIAQCATHMRNIVNDILTISKLDSGLLVITPVDAQPESITRHAVKMFEAEAKAAGVDLTLTIDQSFRDLRIDWVSLDPTRVLQVLINLLTNAIKFTRLEFTRRISVNLAASVEEPTSQQGGIQFITDRLVHEDHRLQEDWKQDPDPFFLQFSVTDTGRGLSEEEGGTLFARFSQASPRTHIHYGGSGLGLFISRRLTELQGGAIGLASQPKKGSTFSFYIKTRRAKPALGRKGSIPTVFPEDIRHRPETPLISLPRPAQPSRGTTTDNDTRSNIGSTTPASTISIDPLGLPPGPNLQELKLAKSSPEILHVLVVEDNLVNQRVLAKQLRSLGCVVSVANHGREALDFLPKTTCWNHNHPTSTRLARRPSFHIPSTEPVPEEETAPIALSLILMDWEMPIMNGLTAVAKIRELEKNGIMKGRVPVIGVTANVRQQQIETAIAAGMDDVVGKPFRVAELLERMRGIVAGVPPDY